MKWDCNFVADFETNTNEDTCAKNPVWAWGACKVGELESYSYGISIDSFMQYAKKNHGRYWFHNLAFDGKFIIDWALRNGFRHVDEYPQAGEFTTLIDRMGKFYSIEINMNGIKIQFADSLKKVTMSLANAAKTYDLEMTKGEINYNEYRPAGHELTSLEADYLRRDVLILAQVMEKRLKMGEKLTTSSDCLAVYKDDIGTTEFKRLFPILPKRADHDIRQSYRGGYVYVNPLHQNKDISKAGVSLDVNSMYPYVMRYRTYPYGMPEFVMDESELYGLFVCHIQYSARVKKDGLPCIQIKDDARFNPREYVRDTLGIVSGWFTSVDLALIKDMYDLDIVSFDGAYCFNHREGLFDDYIDINNYNKVHARNPGERFEAKLRNNSLYGKFGQKIEGVRKVPELNSEDNTVHYIENDGEERDPVYIPVASFVTSYARDYLIRTAVKFGDDYIYSDTDSIKAFGDVPKWLETDHKKLGFFDDEYHFKRCKFIRPKTYAVELDTGEYIYKCAGMPDGLKKVMRFEDFSIGFTNDKRLSKTIDSRYLAEECFKLVPKNVPGGVILEKRPFTIRK